MDNNGKKIFTAEDFVKYGYDEEEIDFIFFLQSVGLAVVRL